MIKQTAAALNLPAAAPSATAGMKKAGSTCRRSAFAARPLPSLIAAANENAPDLDAATRLAAEALAREKARQQRERMRAEERRRWLTLLVMVLMLVAGLKVFAEDVVRALPGAAKYYRMAGVPVPLPGLELEALHVRWMPAEQGRHELVVSGRIGNRTGREVMLAPVRLTLLDALGQPLFSWSIGKGGRRLAHGARARFHARLGAVPEKAESVQVRLIPAVR